MKTRAQVEHLKDNWKLDPCWDIEDTDGFEEYSEELFAYRLEMEKFWSDKHEAQNRDRALQMGIGDNPQLAMYIHRLEQRIASLESITDSRFGL